MGKNTEKISAIQEEAREGFDLRARLAGAPRLEKTVTVFTDAKTGAELGGAEDIHGAGGIVLDRRRWGVEGRIEELGERAKRLLADLERGAGDTTDIEEQVAEIEKEIAALRKKAASLLKTLDSSALVFTLVAVPDFVLRDARRKARKKLGIKGKGIEGMEEEFSLEYTAVLLASSVSSWTDNASGDTFDELSVEQARDLRDHLPAGQFKRLDEAMYELSLEVQIGNRATDDVDFS